MDVCFRFTREDKSTDYDDAILPITESTFYVYTSLIGTQR